MVKQHEISFAISVNLFCQSKLNINGLLYGPPDTPCSCIQWFRHLGCICYLGTWKVSFLHNQILHAAGPQCHELVCEIFHPVQPFLIDSSSLGFRVQRRSI